MEFCFFFSCDGETFSEPAQPSPSAAALKESQPMDEGASAVGAAGERIPRIAITLCAPEPRRDELRESHAFAVTASWNSALRIHRFMGSFHFQLPTRIRTKNRHDETSTHMRKSFVGVSDGFMERNRERSREARASGAGSEYPLRTRPAHGEFDQFRCRLQIQLLAHVPAVRFHCLDAHVELGADFARCHPLADVAKDLELAIRQPPHH